MEEGPASRDLLCAAARALPHPRTLSTKTRRSFCWCPVRNQERLTAKAAGAAGWVLPPGLGGKQPLPERHDTGEGLGSRVQHRRPPLVVGRDLGSSLWFSICFCPACQLPACPGRLGARSITEVPGKSGQSWSGPRRMEEGWGGCGDPGPSPLPKGFFGQELAVPKPPGKGNLV